MSTSFRHHLPRCRFSKCFDLPMGFGLSSLWLHISERLHLVTRCPAVWVWRCYQMAAGRDSVCNCSHTPHVCEMRRAAWLSQARQRHYERVCVCVCVCVCLNMCAVDKHMGYKCLHICSLHNRGLTLHFLLILGYILCVCRRADFLRSGRNTVFAGSDPVYRWKGERQQQT